VKTQIAVCVKLSRPPQKNINPHGSNLRGRKMFDIRASRDVWFTLCSAAAFSSTVTGSPLAFFLLFFFLCFFSTSSLSSRFRFFFPGFFFGLLSSL
jgi:hypothetical protein